MLQVLALKTAEEAHKDAEYMNGHDRKRQRTEPSVPGLDLTDDEDEVSALLIMSSKMLAVLSAEKPGHLAISRWLPGNSGGWPH